MLAEGDRVPADAVLVQSQDLQTDESLVCTENLNPDVVVMKSAKDRV